MRRAIRHRIADLLFIAGTALAAIGWTGYAHGQEENRRVGLLSFFAVTDAPAVELELETLRRNLAERGWVEGKNLTFEFRTANGDPSQFAKAAAELVELKVDVIWAISAPATRAAFSATRTTPIVAIDFTTDPIAEGYIQSYARPGGNVTGVFLDTPEIAGKWFEALKAINPGLSRVAVLWDPGPGANHLNVVRNVAEALDIELQVLEVNKPGDIDGAFQTATREKFRALVILPSPMLWYQSSRLARLALKHQLLAISMADEFVSAGGALSFGPETSSTDDRNAVLLEKILEGTKPGSIPVERPTKFKLSVNMNTAKTLGLTIPESILLRADEVIR